MSVKASITWSLGSAAIAAGSVLAQPTRIVPGHEDVSPNAISLLHLDMDNRVPTGFEHVYRYSNPDPFGRGQPLFMRIDGAVTAVFPRSVYVPTYGGLMPEIPPGTIFQIGPLPTPAPAPRSGRLASNYIDTAVHPEIEDAKAAAWAALPARSLDSLFTNDLYRRRRVAALLSRDPADR